MKIYTLGTSNRSFDEFLEILKFYQIQIVMDVRHWPTSHLFPHFKKENLEKSLKGNNIEYFHFEKLGGFRGGGYQNYTKTRDFQKALEELIEISKSKNVAIICAEKFPWKCHRAFIAGELEEKGIEIIHIIEKDKIWQPKKDYNPPTALPAEGWAPPREIKPKCQPRQIKAMAIFDGDTEKG